MRKFFQNLCYRIRHFYENGNVRKYVRRRSMFFESQTFFLPTPHPFGAKFLLVSPVLEISHSPPSSIFVAFCTNSSFLPISVDNFSPPKILPPSRIFWPFFYKYNHGLFLKEDNAYVSIIRSKIFIRIICFIVNLYNTIQ